MAMFRVRQRVRVVALITEVERYRFLLGKEGMIVGRGEQLGYPTDDAWVVDIPGCVGEITELCGRTEWNLHASELAPLTDPGADAFIERIKKLKPYEEPKVPARNPEYSMSADFLAAVKRLVIAGRTTGGTAGRDEGLCAALDAVEAHLQGSSQ